VFYFVEIENLRTYSSQNSFEKEQSWELIETTGEEYYSEKDTHTPGEQPIINRGADAAHGGESSL
jgi:hypothetical protein